MTNPAAYAALAGVSMAALVGFGLTSFTGSLRLEAFGLRQVAGAVLGLVLAAGILPAGPRRDGRDVGRGAARPDDPTGVDGGERDGGGPLPCPVDHGRPGRRASRRRPAIRRAGSRRATPRSDTPSPTGRARASWTPGRPLAGPGPDRLEQTLAEILGGTTRHGGALLAPFGVRFVAAERTLLPEAVAHAFQRQVDLNLVPAAGFTILRNDTAIPPAAVLETGPAEQDVIASADPATIATWRPVPSVPLERVPGGWDGPAAEGTVFLSTEFDPGWELDGREVDPDVAFGWATSFAADGEPVRVRHEGSVAAGSRSRCSRWSGWSPCG